MIGLRMMLVKSSRTLVIEFMREPFGASWIGEPGLFTVAQIADGSGVEVRRVRKVLAKLGADIRREKVGRLLCFGIPKREEIGDD